MSLPVSPIFLGWLQCREEDGYPLSAAVFPCRLQVTWEAQGHLGGLYDTSTCSLIALLPAQPPNQLPVWTQRDPTAQILSIAGQRQGNVCLFFAARHRDSSELPLPSLVHQLRAASAG